jgi:trehalose-phosphatase
MKSLLLDRAHWRERLGRGPLAVFLDYDGTLSHIALTPAQAKLPSRTREILAALVKLSDVRVAVISGRALGVLRELVKVQGLSYVGSHGAEFSSPGTAPRGVSKKYYSVLRDLKQKLASGLGGVPGVLFEHKPVSFAIHYRKTAPSVERKVRKLILDVCRGPVEQGVVSLMRGKKVIEIMPPNPMNKGQAAQRLLRMWGRQKYLPVFIGDDTTDEAAFEVLRAGGLTVKVGAPHARSAAEYYLDSVEEVRLFLRTILRIRTSRKGASHDPDAQ